MKFFLLTAAVLYLSLNLLVVVQGKYYQRQLDKFDLDESGFFEANEQTPDQQAAMLLVTSDTARTFAPLTLIPVALVIAGLATGARAIYKSV